MGLGPFWVSASTGENAGLNSTLISASDTLEFYSTFSQAVAMFPQANYLTSLTLSFFFCKKRDKKREVPGSPVVRTWHFHSRGPGFNPTNCAARPKERERETKRNISQATAVDYKNYLINAQNKGWLLTELFIYSFSKYLFSTYYVPGTALGAGDTAVKKANKNFCPPRA